jgi:hypothetical protein
MATAASGPSSLFTPQVSLALPLQAITQREVDAANEVTQKSLENNVDQLWSCVFRHFFPFSEGYLIVPRDHLDDTANAPDITIKQLKDGVVYIILTMENKRAELLLLSNFLLC